MRASCARSARPTIRPRVWRRRSAWRTKRACRASPRCSPNSTCSTATSMKARCSSCASRRGWGVVTYFSLASGYLSGKYRGADDLGKSPRGARVKPYLEGRGPAVLAVMDGIAAETGATLSQIALAWVAAQPGVTAPIASATTVEQLDELMGSVDLKLSEDHLAALSAA